MVTSSTTQFRRTCCDWIVSVARSAARGGMPCCDEVNGTGSTGPDSIASLVSTSRHAGFCILIRRSASSRHDLRQEPYAVTLHVRICAGGGQQWPSLPRPVPAVFGESEYLGREELSWSSVDIDHPVDEIEPSVCGTTRTGEATLAIDLPRFEISD